MRHGTGNVVAGFLLGVIAAVAMPTAGAGQRPGSPQGLFPGEVAQRLDATIKEIMQSNNLPNAALEAAIPGKGRYVFVGGIANLATGAPRRLLQPFRIASLTKTFVATAMLSDIADLARYVRVLCRGGLLKAETQQARLRGQPLGERGPEYGEGLITGPSACGHSGTAPGFSTDMYYLGAIDATLVISINRLDRDDRAQSPPVLKAVLAALAAQFGKF